MESVRSFIAVELPDDVRQEIYRQMEQLRALAGRLVKWTPAGNLHATMKFLGPVPLDKIDELHELLKGAVSGFYPFNLEAHGTGAFPGGKFPRVLWVGLKGPSYETLSSLRDSIEDACEKAGFERETSAFKAHITLGRVRPEGMKDRRALAGLTEGLATLQAHSFGMIEIGKITLMKSVLKPGGPEYSLLKEIYLGRQG